MGYDELKHHGISGMKWGIRNGPPYPLKQTGKGSSNLTTLETRTSRGAVVTMSQKPTPKFTAFISKYFPSIKDNIEKDKQFNVTVDGKRVGDCEIYKESAKSLNVVWVGIDNTHRGQGYATAVMNGVIKYAKQEKFKQVTLEVPGDSPDARHIYEKLGFVADKVVTEDDVWGGLTSMILELDDEW